jgi:hypothetical protein
MFIRLTPLHAGRRLAPRPGSLRGWWAPAGSRGPGAEPGNSGHAHLLRPHQYSPPPPVQGLKDAAGTSRPLGRLPGIGHPRAQGTGRKPVHHREPKKDPQREGSRGHRKVAPITSGSGAHPGARDSTEHEDKTAVRKSATTEPTAAKRAPRRRGVTEQGADAAVDQACRSLRLPTMRARFADARASACRSRFVDRPPSRLRNDDRTHRSPVSLSVGGSCRGPANSAASVTTCAVGRSPLWTADGRQEGCRCSHVGEGAVRLNLRHGAVEFPEVSCGGVWTGCVSKSRISMLIGLFRQDDLGKGAR